jgi:hypothetical protein
MAKRASRCDDHRDQRHGATRYHRRPPAALGIVVATRRRSDSVDDDPSHCPLTTAESSLRWPLQHQLTLGVHDADIGDITKEEQPESLDT